MGAFFSPILCTFLPSFLVISSDSGDVKFCCVWIPLFPQHDQSNW